METTVLLVFGVVYLGMILGGLPFLSLDRTGIALLGAIALIGAGAVSLEEAWQAVHVPTLILLFAFMVVSAQLRMGGFYNWVTHKTGHLPLSPRKLLAALIAIVALLSAVFSNDVVCLAMAPVLIDVCLARRLNPIPYLLALACSANVGSALTLIGNPQNMLIGERLKLSFSGYLLEAAIPVLLGLFVVWALHHGVLPDVLHVMFRVFRAIRLRDIPRRVWVNEKIDAAAVTSCRICDDPCPVPRRNPAHFNVLMKICKRSVSIGFQH